MSNYHQNIICQECGLKAPHKAHGLCVRCYQRKYLQVYYLSEENKARYDQWHLNFELRQSQSDSMREFE